MPKIKRRPMKTHAPKSSRAKQGVGLLRTHLVGEQRQRNKENSSSTSGSARLVTDNDPMLACVKVEVEETHGIEDDQPDLVDFPEEIDIPFKLEKIDSLEYNNIKEESFSDNEALSSLSDNNKGLDLVIEWALNLQFDHSKRCTGRLYPCRDIIHNINCRIVVLYCTVCKKRMLHALKDWSMLQ